MVTRRHDRSLEFLGRRDTQYKIRGYRIEVGDVEATLLAHPQVAQATVIVLDGVLVDSKAIVAFAVLKNRSSLTSRGLLDFVSDRLPGYMIPSRCVLLDNMPLTRSGKVDRSALQGLAGALRTSRAGGTQKPEGIIEETLERMWAHLLKRNQVAPEEDFFQLGGQSLVAIQIISRIQKVFGVRLPLNAILEAPTVRALAKRVEAESCVLNATT
jgi:acyl carrier protein